MTGLRKVRLTAEARRVFLEAIGAGWSAERAAEVAGVARQRFYERRAQDPDFAEAWSTAYDSATEMLRDELRRRSMEGYTETVLDADGKVIRRTERMHPADLHLELKRRDPAYREGAPIAIAAAGELPSLESSLGRPVTSLADVIQRARELGMGHLIGLDVVRDGVAEQESEAPLALNPGPLDDGGRGR